MAQVNTEDNSLSYFPWNKYKICVYGGDHGPAHFHIIDRQNKWDIRIDVISGELISVKKYGNRRKSDKFTDIIKDVKRWLDEPSMDYSMQGKDNRDVVIYNWNVNNPELKLRTK